MKRPAFALLAALLLQSIAVMANEGEQYSPDGYDSDAEKQAGAIYGIPADCAEALETSIRWSRDAERARTRITGNETEQAA